MLLEGAAERGRPQAVAVVQAVRDERSGVGAEPAERGREDRERADPVTVVVAEDDDAPAARRGRRETLDGLRQAAHAEGVVQTVRRRRQVGARGLDVVEPPGREDARGRRGKGQLAREPRGRFRVLRPETAADEPRGADPRAHAPSQAPIARNFA